MYFFFFRCHTTPPTSFFQKRRYGGSRHRVRSFATLAFCKRISALCTAIKAKCCVCILSLCKRQTSPRIKRPPSQRSFCSPRWRSIIFAAHNILSGLSREAAFQPMFHQFRSVAARFAEPTADNGTDQGHSPSPFQSGCRSRRWPARHRAYWQRANFFRPITNGLMLRSARLLLSSRRPSSRYLARYGHCSSR